MSKSNLPKRMITTALATGGFAIAGALAFGPSAEAAENPVPNTAQDADAIDLDKIEKEADDLIAELEAAPPKPPADAPAEADPVQNAEPPPAQDTQQVPENPGQQNSETQSEPEDSATSDEDGDDDGVVPTLPGAVAPAVGADPADDEIDKALDNWIDGLDEQVADGIAGAGDLFPGVTGLLNQGVNPVPVGQPAGDPVDDEDAWIDGLDDVVSDGIAGVGDAFVAGTDLLNQGVNLLPDEQPEADPVDEAVDGWIDGLDDVVSDGIAGVGDAFVAGTDLLNQGVSLLPDEQGDPVDEALDSWIDGLDDGVSDAIAGVGDAFVSGTDLLNQAVDLLPGNDSQDMPEGDLTGVFSGLLDDPETAEPAVQQVGFTEQGDPLRELQKSVTEQIEAADTPAEVPVVEQSHDRKEGGATELPYTGLELLPAGLAGMALLGLGAGLTFWRRRKTGEAA